MPPSRARKDISLTHTIVHATTNKAKGETPIAGDEDADVALHKVANTEHGIVVRGSRILATLAPFSDDSRFILAIQCPAPPTSTPFRSRSR